MYQWIVFDLDGTLTDPAEGITNSFVYALEREGVVPPSKESLCRYIGPPLLHTFMEEFGFSEEKARHAVEQYRVYFRRDGLYENRVYEGIEALLSHLVAHGKRLAVATSKPEHFAKQILEHFHLDSYFTDIAGAKTENQPKSQVLGAVLEACGITDPSTVLMVGDRSYDVACAKAHGIDCLGVLYGYGSREELMEAGATALAETVAQIEAVAMQ